MRKQRITLEIVWDERIEGSVATVPPPAAWGWRELLDLSADETVEVVHGGPVTKAKATA